MELQPSLVGRRSSTSCLSSKSHHSMKITNTIGFAEEQCSDVRAFLGFFWDFLWNFKAPNFWNFLGIFLRIFWTSIFLVNFLEIFWEIFFQGFSWDFPGISLEVGLEGRPISCERMTRKLIQSTYNPWYVCSVFVC